MKNRCIVRFIGVFNSILSGDLSAERALGRALQIGVVGRITLMSRRRTMASRPVAIPEVFTGEKGQTWSDWREHFDSVAEVNGWSAADKKNSLAEPRLLPRA